MKECSSGNPRPSGERNAHDTRAVLTIAAVAGREFSLPVVASAAGLEIDHLLDIIDSAIVTGILVEVPAQPERAGFCHALVRETLYQGLAGLRKARLHRRLAQAIEEQPDAAGLYVNEAGNLRILVRIRDIVQP